MLKMVMIVMIHPARDLLHAHVCMASFMLMRVKKATLTPLNGDPYNEAHARGLFHAHAREEGHAHVRVSIARARPQLAKVHPGCPRQLYRQP